uniref:Uncharacterized protein n=1 Tax=Oryza punctata TaxID=4537 RepID=A0A0E0K7V3_ORYPU
MDGGAGRPHHPRRLAAAKMAMVGGAAVPAGGTSSFGNAPRGETKVISLSSRNESRHWWANVDLITSLLATLLGAYRIIPGEAEWMMTKLNFDPSLLLNLCKKAGMAFN